MQRRTPEIGLRARAVEERDLAIRVAWLNDPRVYTGLAIDPPISLAHSRQWLTKSFGNATRVDFSFLPLEGDAPVAMGGLTAISHRDRHAELYVFVDPEKHGMGIGLKATSWLCRFGFEERALERIYLWMHASNHAALRLYTRLGFQIEGTLRAHRMQNGELVDRLVLGLLKHEWCAGRAA